MFRWWSCHHTHRRIFCFGIGTAYTQHTQHSPLYLFVCLCFLHAFAQITSRSFFFFFFRLYNASYNTHYKHIYICTLLTLCYEHYSCVYNSNRFYYTRKMFRLRRGGAAVLRVAYFKTRKQHFFTNFICFFFRSYIYMYYYHHTYMSCCEIYSIVFCRHLACRTCVESPRVSYSMGARRGAACASVLFLLNEFITENSVFIPRGIFVGFVFGILFYYLFMCVCICLFVFFFFQVENENNCV